MMVMSPDVDYLTNGFTPTKTISPVLTNIVLPTKIHQVVATITPTMITPVKPLTVVVLTPLQQTIVKTQTTMQQSVQQNCINKCLQTVVVAPNSPVPSTGSCVLITDPTILTQQTTSLSVTGSCMFCGNILGIPSLSCGNGTYLP